MKTVNTNEWIYIDSFLKGTEKFWNALVINCVIDCCGIDALDLSEERILEASTKVNASFLLEKFENLISYLEEHPLQKIQSNDIINHGSDKREFIQLLEKIRKSVLGINYS